LFAGNDTSSEAPTGNSEGPDPDTDALLALVEGDDHQARVLVPHDSAGHQPVPPMGQTAPPGRGQPSRPMILAAMILAALVLVAVGLAAGIGLPRADNTRGDGDLQRRAESTGASSPTRPPTRPPTTSSPTTFGYNLVITGVPAGVGAVNLRVNREDPTCLAVAPGRDTSAGVTVRVGDTVTAIWQTDRPCTPQTSLERVSVTQVESGSRLATFGFNLSEHRII
jgi:hypothetical protein